MFDRNQNIHMLKNADWDKLDSSVLSFLGCYLFRDDPLGKVRILTQHAGDIASTVNYFPETDKYNTRTRGMLIDLPLPKQSDNEEE